MSNQIKVLFVQKVNDEFQTEGLWCNSNGDNFIVDNIPFIAKRISLGDEIKVDYDQDDGAYYFDDFITVSGNSTIRIYVENAGIIPDIRNQLDGFGCESEVFLERNIIAVNVPKQIIYSPIKRFLDKGENDNLWTYEESCLAHEY